MGSRLQALSPNKISWGVSKPYLSRKGFLCLCAIGALGLFGCSSPSQGKGSVLGDNEVGKKDSAFNLLGIFVVEPTDEVLNVGVDLSSIPDAYQLVQSMSPRADFAALSLSASQKSSSAGDAATATVGFSTAMVCFLEDAQYGISLMSDSSASGNAVIATSACPTMSFEKMASLDQQRLAL